MRKIRIYLIYLLTRGIFFMRIKIVFILFLLFASSACERRDHSPVQGYVEVDNLYLASPYSGTLSELAVYRGETVKKDQLIFKLDPNPELLKVREGESVLQQEKERLLNLQTAKRPEEIKIAEARLKQVEERIKLADLRMKRFRELYKRKAGTLDEADAATHRYTELEALITERKLNLKLAQLGARSQEIAAQKSKIRGVANRLFSLKWALMQKTVYAPMDGVIFDTFFIEGEWVPEGQPIASLMVLDRIKIDFFVPASRLSSIQLNQKINVSCVGCPRNSKAQIVFISPEAEYVPPLVYSRKNYDKLVFRVQAKPLNPKAFKPGQPVTVSGF